MKKIIVLMVLAVLQIAVILSYAEDCSQCHLAAIEHPTATTLVIKSLMLADLRSDFKKQENFGEPLVSIEAEKGSIIARMDRLRIKLNNLEGRASGKFGAGSVEVIEIQGVATKTKTDFQNAANNW